MKPVKKGKSKDHNPQPPFLRGVLKKSKMSNAESQNC